LPSVDALTFSSIDLDRAFLRSLDRIQWRTVATRVRERVTDDVIGSASEALPPEHFAIHGDDLVRKLRARRTGIMRAAMRFYDRLAEYVDVHGTDARDRADILRAADGSVQVRLYSADPPTIADDGTNGGVALEDAQPYYSRTFLPGETKEVRLYLYGGADRAVVSGVAERSSIRVRVVGGPGDDVLVDSALVGADGAWAWLYDAEGSNRFVRNEHTVADRRAFQPPAEPRDWVAQKIARERFRDWGSSQGFQPAIEYRSNTGFIAGVEWNARQYGFRRMPFESEWEAQGLYAPGAGAFGATAQITRHLENSPIGIIAAARASGFDDIRFYGFGNESSELPSDRSRVERLLLLTRAGLQYAMAGGYAAVGGLVQHTRTPTNEHPVLAETHPFGVGDFTQVGLWAEAERATADDALRLSLVGAFYPPFASVTSSYGKLRAIGVARLGSAPILALRAGGEQVWGRAPFHDAAFLGGRSSLRGYPPFRFVGDAAVFGNAELRVPIAIVKLLARGELGAFALGDAGRVFVGGSSPGDWHTAYGGGL
ncbi:MAG TPA: hypothetical protein VK864_14310, partial [Longimicrobiales bacterium]|nr:hypothetical protein [Longimicrobiales bacterium]